MPYRSWQFRIDDIIEAINKIGALYIGANFKTSPFVRYLRQAQILILEILLVFLGLKFSPSLISNKIEHFETASYGIDFASWQNDEKTVDAVIRNLEVIGESSSHLPLEIQKQYEDVPWGMMKGIRNILTHKYFGIDLEIVWKTVKDDLPILKKQLL